MLVEAGGGGVDGLDEAVAEEDEGQDVAENLDTSSQIVDTESNDLQNYYDGDENQEDSSFKVLHPKQTGNVVEQDEDSSFKVLHPKGSKGGNDHDDGSKGNISHPITTTILLLSFLLLCLCYRRIKKGKKSRQYGHYPTRIPNRGKYAQLGSDDYFNGTFSDDISFGRKDSDNEDDYDFDMDSYDSDDDAGDGGGVALEMGGIHELDANGGLTLDEVNG